MRPPDGLLARAVATLDPGYFAWVMASGIVSVGTDLLGDGVISRVVLGVTIFAFALLVLAYLARLVFFGASARRDLCEPSSAVAYFTVVAGTGVLAARLSLAGHPLAVLFLGAVAAVVWLALTYWLPWSVVTSARKPALGDLSGTWLLWVVSTQSLSIVSSSLSGAQPLGLGALRAQLPAVALCLWGVGVTLYMVLIVLVFQRLLFVEVSPSQMAPAYWITMGATAISVRAAAGLLALRTTNLPLAELRPFLAGISVVLWAFGTWWIPLLVLFGIWRYLLRRYPPSYEPRLWSAVFPLGMYAVASFSLGRAGHFGFMVTVARLWVWVGVGAWVAVMVLMFAALVGALGRRTPGQPPSPARLAEADRQHSSSND